MSVNKAIIIGNLGQDPDLRYTQGGTAVANLSVATNEKWKDSNGQMQERTEWHRVVVFGATAENCSKYLSKGRQVYVEGRIQTKKYTDKQGVEKYSTEIIAQNVTFLKGGDNSSGGGYQQPQNNQNNVPDDIPF